MEPLKPARNYEEQIDRLIQFHALEIEDRDAAAEILSRVNYYRLSAYGIGLTRKDDREKYQRGISLLHLYRLYEFDSALRSALFHLIEHVEIELRTQFAYHHALRYGPEGYRDAANFSDRLNNAGKSIHAMTMEKLDAEIQRQRHLPCVLHHKAKYGGHFPAWAAIELFTFGMLSSIHSILKLEDQKQIAGFYGVKSIHLRSWIQSLVEVRNRCAHYGRIYNMPFAQAPYLFREYRPYQSNKIFPVLLVLHRMTNGRPWWREFYRTLTGLMRNYPEARPDFMGFPKNWEELLGDGVAPDKAVD